MRRDFEILRTARVCAHEGADAKLGARCGAMEHAKACGSAGLVFDLVRDASVLEAGLQGGQKNRAIFEAGLRNTENGSCERP